MKSAKKLTLVLPLALLTPVLMSNSPAPNPYPLEYNNYSITDISSTISDYNDSIYRKIETTFTFTNTGKGYLALNSGNFLYTYIKTDDSFDVNKIVNKQFSSNDLTNINYLFPNQSIELTISSRLTDNTLPYGVVASSLGVTADNFSAYQESLVVTPEVEEIQFAKNDLNDKSVIITQQFQTTTKGVGLALCSFKFLGKRYDATSYVMATRYCSSSTRFTIQLDEAFTDKEDITDCIIIYFEINSYYYSDHSYDVVISNSTSNSNVPDTVKEKDKHNSNMIIISVIGALVFVIAITSTIIISIKMIKHSRND